MKKLIAIAVVAGFLVPAIAGAEASGLTGKGVKLGLNLANVSGADKPTDAAMAMGLAVGGFATWSVNDMFAVQPEIFYSQKGFQIDAKKMGSPVAGTINFNVNYLDIPVLARLNIPMEGTVKPYVVLGPSFGILLTAEQVASGDVADLMKAANMETTTDVKSDTTSMDMGLVLGAGVEVPAGSGKVTVDVRYDMGLTTLDSSSAKAKMYNSVIGLLVGYAF